MSSATGEPPEWRETVTQGSELRLPNYSRLSHLISLPTPFEEARGWFDFVRRVCCLLG